MTLMITPRALAIVVGFVALLASGAAAEPLRLHPDVPDVLDRAWLDRLQLYPEVEHLVQVQFVRASWGAVLARLEIDDPAVGRRTVERNVTDRGWERLRARAEAVLAGLPLPDEPVSELGPLGPPSPPDSAMRAWPEAPPPPIALPRDLALAGGPVSWSGRWLALVEAGARVDLTPFNQFFTPMAQIGITFGHGLSDRVASLLGFHAGFGDMRADFEEAFGDGRTNAFGFTLNILLRQPYGERGSLYVEGGGGYLIRSLYWGGIFVDPFTGQYVRGQVIEQQNWGYTARVGWLLSRDHPNRPRLLDIGVGVMTSPAARWLFRSDDRRFEADGRDTWLVVSVRFWDGL